MVVDALNKKIVSTLASLRAIVCLADDGSILAKLRARPVFLSKILESQFMDERCNGIKECMKAGDVKNFSLGSE